MSDAPGFHGLVVLFEETNRALQARAARSVDVALVVRNWLFGYYIVEYEQGGADRAQLYGKALIDRLATALSGKGLRGISPTNLRKFRAFYEAYPEIQQTLSVESGGQTIGILLCPPQERGPGRADPAREQQHLRRAIPALPALEGRVEAETHRLGRGGGGMKCASSREWPRLGLDCPRSELSEGEKPEP